MYRMTPVHQSCKMVSTLRFFARKQGHPAHMPFASATNGKFSLASFYAPDHFLLHDLFLLPFSGLMLLLRSSSVLAWGIFFFTIGMFSNFFQIRGKHQCDEISLSTRRGKADSRFCFELLKLVHCYQITISPLTQGVPSSFSYEIIQAEPSGSIYGQATT